ncbi:MULTISPECIES: malonate decarboxylase holo-[acyl-carrier-protein] synthase [Rhodopseudomonas]|nr:MULTISPECIES: malonate decarboxylase holo-[acyl-carrier-protein] synthase [Rhodopseudomonas]MDF3812453.1 malonate decarboxylase holo-[acyl-carrier-protein] synthase [Rhodopseudomonas sp. BAL398]WOK19452.1 malonate decarboxylase holo-[acyl-carrier-protein] synthase [Rhodopseudomonas sp. BAL398]
MVEFSVEERLRSAETVCRGLLPPFRHPALEARVHRVFASEAVPGIICAAKGPLPRGYLQLGVSFPFRDDGSRVRASFALPPKRIGKAHSPYEVFGRLQGDAFEGAAALNSLRALCESHGVEVGLFGSAALQILTGLPYLETNSDVDAVVRPTSYAKLRLVHAGLCDLRDEYKRKFDVEVTLPNGAGVKLNELMSSKTTVLGRGIDGVRLLDWAATVRALDQSESSSVSDELITNEES